jgi:phytoene dehydrogenase-like protein
MDGRWHELPEKGQIQTLLSLLEKTGDSKAKILGRLAQGAVTEKILGVFRRNALTDQANRLSFRDWLKQYTDDERVLKLFHALTSAMSTVNDYEYPASHWFTYVSSAGQGGMRYHGVSPRGNIENANSLAEAVRRKGGEAWTGAPLTKINVRNGRVTSAVIEKGGREVDIECGLLISDLGPRKTVELAGRTNFPADYLKQVDALRPAPIVANIIASDKPLVQSNGGLLIIGAKRIVAGVPLTLYSPELAPPGKHLTVVWGTPESCLKHVDPASEAKTNLEDLRIVFPDFDRHARLLRQDIRDIDDEFPALRSWMGYDMAQDSPIPNLFHVGDAVKPFGWEGVAACARGAQLAAEKVRRKFKPVE